MLITPQTIPLTQSGSASGTLVVQSAANLAPGIIGYISDSDSGPETFQIQTINYATNTITVTINGLYVNLSYYTTAGGARIFIPQQQAFGGYVPIPGGGIYTSSTMPTASASYVGITILVQDPGQPMSQRLCVKNSDGTYAWTITAVAPV